MIFPQPLKKGDTIAILTPATIVKPEYIDGAARRLEAAGYKVCIMPHAKGPADGSFAASADARRADLLAALSNPDVKAILCARGGYGCVQLIADLDDAAAANPKWLIGFSDITALHALMQRHGIASIHGPMAKHFTTLPDDDPTICSEMALLTETAPMVYRWKASAFDRPGTACGRLVGGNLALLSALAGTPYDMCTRAFSEDTIIFIEDVSEAIYSVERMLYRMLHAGVLNKVKGLIFGQFTDYRPDKNHNTMEQMIDRFLSANNLVCPVAMNAPIGHVDHNMPILVGCTATLTVESGGHVILRQSRV